MRAAAGSPVVLGLDPGTRVMGWAVVARVDGRLRSLGHGALRAPAALPTGGRLLRLVEGVRALLARYEPAEAALEEVFYGKDARAAQRIGEARGALLLALAEAGVPVCHYANNVVKRAVAGAGRASKEQVRAMVARLLGLTEPPTPLDASDALGLAICHHQRRGLVAGPAGLPPRVAAALKAARARGP